MARVLRAVGRVATRCAALGAGAARGDFASHDFSGTITTVADLAQPSPGEPPPPIHTLEGRVHPGDAIDGRLSVDLGSPGQFQYRETLDVSTPIWGYHESAGVAGSYDAPPAFLVFSADLVTVPGVSLLSPTWADRVDLPTSSPLIAGFTRSLPYV